LPLTTVVQLSQGMQLPPHLQNIAVKYIRDKLLQSPIFHKFVQVTDRQIASAQAYFAERPLEAVEKPIEKTSPAQTAPSSAQTAPSPAQTLDRRKTTDLGAYLEALKKDIDKSKP